MISLIYGTTGNTRGCRGRAWAFERRPGRELRGHDDFVLRNVPSRRDCEERCLSETRFVCRSAEYHTQVCFKYSSSYRSSSNSVMKNTGL